MATKGHYSQFCLFYALKQRLGIWDILIAYGYNFKILLQKKLTHVPPHLASSMTAAFTPNSAALRALARPPEPPPITR